MIAGHKMFDPELDKIWREEAERRWNDPMVWGELKYKMAWEEAEKERFKKFMEKRKKEGWK